MIQFLLIVNKQGQKRVSKYFNTSYVGDKNSQENEIIRKCFTRSEKQCSFFEHKNFKVVYKRYAMLYFIIGVEENMNELAMLEFIHNIVETFDKYFSKVCELDLMFNLDRVHMILDEMVMNQCIVETNKTKILSPILLMDQVVAKR